MSRFRIEFVVFAAGLAAVCGIAVGYVGSNWLALAVTLLIGACYVAGALELRRYSQATGTLARAVAGLSEPPPRLGAWLELLHPGLRNAARLRIEGERVALPGPALTPYLVGLLVLLGMLGTLLGMVVTLRGTGMALESATDLAAIRASLAAPVKGLGFAFGTSIAGVASSAMLGLLSALCRRERLEAAQRLDVKIATSLRIYSQAHQRDEIFRLLQTQAELMPTLVDRLQTMMAAMEQHSLAFNERQLANQEAFHSNAQVAYTRLAASVEQSLKRSIADSTRAAGEALEPVMQATMAGLARESAALHASVGQAVQQQLDGLSSGFESAAATVADIWSKALAGQQRSNEDMTQQFRASIERFTQTFDERSAGLVDGVSARLEAAAGNVSQTWKEALSRQEQAGETLAVRHEQALAAAAASFEERSASLVRTVGQSHADLRTELASQDEARLAAWTATLASMAANLGKEWEQAGERSEARLAAWTSKLDSMAANLGKEWQQAGERNEERLTAWTSKLDSMAATLGKEWQQAGERTASRQQEICDTLSRTATDIAAQTQAHASETIAEISRLVQAASEAPKAAAEVVAELRQKLSDSMVRDTAMLQERSRLMETLETLLDAVNHASTEQRTAVDALVATSADLLERVGTRFTDKVETEADRIGAIAAQITGGAVEVASLGEAFGAAVQRFGESNDKLVAHLETIEAALDKSLARSDEQLAYYVAQAREVVDLSVMSQKQIVEDLQLLAAQRAADGAEAA
ncbi:DUF802 domain-containing protein [Paraburkholderia caledonica]|uniref:DUF802 domain-containing protein n=1 Tax=Paraburkholderia caledonica TaxID=134536 RepID=UPI000DEF7C5F|nr:DUF802 domain-containing protein [Paraburkholderia caledonica]AXF16300.1 DUF802 domain-containing protein [Paraburkholderia caledonica]